MRLWNSNVIFNERSFWPNILLRKLERNCDVEISKGNWATLLLFGGNYCTISLCTCGWAANNQQTTTKVRSIFEFRVGHQNWWITLNLDQNHMYVNFRFSKGFSFLNQCFAQLRFWKSVSDSQNLLAGATAVLLETLFQNRNCAKHWYKKLKPLIFKIRRFL